MEDNECFGKLITWDESGKKILIPDIDCFISTLSKVQACIPENKGALLKQFQLHRFKKMRVPKICKRWSFIQQDGHFIRSERNTAPQSDLLEKLHMKKRIKRRKVRRGKKARDSDIITGLKSRICELEGDNAALRGLLAVREESIDIPFDILQYLG